MAPILNSTILDSAILVLPLNLTHTWQDWFPPFAQKKPSLIHSDSTSWCAAILNSTMMDSDTAILNSAMLDSDSFLSSPRFTQKHSHSTLTLTQTNLIWLKLIHSHSTWWWQPSWILPCWIKNFTHSFCTQLDDGSHLEFCHVGFRHLVFFSQIHSWIWPSWIQPS